jgi:hypothetical protein
VANVGEGRPVIEGTWPIRRRSTRNTAKPDGHPACSTSPPHARNAIGERDFSALYQQRPAPDEGVYFKRERFKWYDEPPQHLHTYGGSDYATKAGDGDYTVHAVVGIDSDDNMYVLEVWRGQTTSDIWIERFCDLVLRHKPMGWGAPRDQIKRSIGPFMIKRMESAAPTARLRKSPRPATSRLRRGPSRVARPWAKSICHATRHGWATSS